MREKIKRFRERISNIISNSPIYKKFIRKRDKLAEQIKNGLLAVFYAIGPVWTFLFVKTQDLEASEQPSNQVRQEVRILVRLETVECVFCSIFRS